MIATQNPIEMEGTYPLPEAQLDRFLCRIDLAAPTQKELEAVLAATTSATRARSESVLHLTDVLEIRALVRQVPVSKNEIARVARIVLATDPTGATATDEIKRFLRYGASPRGGQAILALAKARALVAGRPWVSGEDVDAVAAPALRHRLVFGYEGEASGVHPDELVRAVVQRA